MKIQAYILQDNQLMIMMMVGKKNLHWFLLRENPGGAWSRISWLSFKVIFLQQRNYCSSQVDKGKSDRFSRMWYWLVLDCTGSVEGGTGCYLVVLGHCRMILVDIWWCSVSTGRYWLVLDGTGSVEGGTGWYLMVLGQYGAVLDLVDTWWYWVSRRRYWLIHDGTGSVWGSTCWYMVAMDQYKAVMVDPWWYWVSIGRYWLVLGGTGSVEGGTRSV